MLNNTPSGIEVYSNVQNIINVYGKPRLDIEDLKEYGLKHILVKGDGYILFSLLLTRKSMLKLIDKNVEDIIEEKIVGFQGIYGYSGVNSELINKYKDMQENSSGSKYYSVIVEYKGDFLVVNSGPLSGMVLIQDNFEDINFKSINS